MSDIKAATAKLPAKPNANTFPVLIKYIQMLEQAKGEEKALQRHCAELIQTWQSIAKRINALPDAVIRITEPIFNPFTENLMHLAALKARLLGDDDIPQELRQLRGLCLPRLLLLPLREGQGA